MSLEMLLSIIMMGLVSGNVITSSGLGIDIAGNNLNTIKNSLILSLIVFCVTLCSGVVIFVTNLILVNAGLESMLVIVAFLVVAIMVQIAEFILKKIFPVMYTKLRGFIVTMIPAVSIILLSLFTSALSVGVMLLDIIFIGLGITAVLVVISGVRNNKLTYSSYDVFKGNLMTIVILFVMALIWTAV